MNILDLATMGESSRIDYLVRELEKSESRFNALVMELVRKNVLTHEQAQAIAGAGDQPGG